MTAGFSPFQYGMIWLNAIQLLCLNHTDAISFVSVWWHIKLIMQKVEYAIWNYEKWGDMSAHTV